MCGFSGILKLNSENNIDILEVVSSMNERLKHRGPDDKGTWIDNKKVVSFSHRRLSIVDLSEAGHQPMISKCGRYVIVFNGEIYNHRLIRNQIETYTNNSKSILWEGQSDTETILEAISIWGFEKSINKFIGMFSIACWDKEKNELLLTRDRIGEKPLYYGIHNNLFVFSSEIKAFKEVKDFSLEINKEIIPIYISRNFIPAPYSIYKNIYKLKPGTFLRINENIFLENREIKAIPYWDLEKDAITKNYNEYSNMSDQEIIDNIDFLLKKSISDQLLADVPVGAFLSGGIDSSLVVSIMKSITNKKIKTFSLGFNEIEYDESNYAKKIAKYLDTDHTEYKLTSKEAIKIIANLPNIYDEPFADVSQIPMVMISQIAQKSVKVCLSGDGGDELFGGYNRYIYGANLWKILNIIALPFRKFIAKLMYKVPFKNIEYIFRFLSLKRFSKLRLNLLGQKFHKFANLLTTEKISQIYSKVAFENNIEAIFLDKNNFNLINSDIEYLPKIDLPHNLMYQDTKYYLPDNVLCKVDRAAMYSSLETRLPMLDKRLIDFAWKIPISKKIRFFEGKWILRKLLKRYLPSYLFQRPKSGFSVPIGDWLKGPLKNWAEELLDPSRLKKEEFFDHNVVNLKWEEHINGEKDWSKLLWSILIFQIWLDHNK